MARSRAFSPRRVAKGKELPLRDFDPGVVGHGMIKILPIDRMDPKAMSDGAHRHRSRIGRAAQAARVSPARAIGAR